MDLYFADDSINNNCIGYLSVGITDENIIRFLDIYKRIKAHFKIAPDYCVHSKDFFNEKSRMKIESIQHLSDKDCMNFFLKSYEHYSQLGFRPILAISDKRNFNFPAERMEFENFVPDEKQILNFLKSAIKYELFLVHGNNTDHHKFFADKVHKNDKISKQGYPISGVRRRSMMPGNLLEPNMTGLNEFTRLPETKYEDADYKEMYEIADMCVYICTKALSIQIYKNKELFINVYKFIDPIILQYQSKITNRPNAPQGDNYRN